MDPVSEVAKAKTAEELAKVIDAQGAQATERVEAVRQRRMTAPSGKVPKVRGGANVVIRSFQGKTVVPGVNLAAGMSAKLLPGEICSVPGDLADLFEDSDLIEITRKDANCRLVDGVIVRE